MSAESKCKSIINELMGTNTGTENKNNKEKIDFLLQNFQIVSQYEDLFKLNINLIIHILLKNKKARVVMEKFTLIT